MLTMSQFIESYSELGAKKTRAPAARLLLLGLLAGFFIAMAAAASSTAAHCAGDAGTAKLISGLLFPFGLVMVLLTGAELFTGNCLITISLLNKRAGLGGMCRNLLIVYMGNFLGALLVAAACAFSGQLGLSGGELGLYAIRLAAAKCSLSFGKALVLGIMCNILVCTAVACGLSASSLPGRALGAYLPTCFFVVCGFEHCVANMYYIPAGLLAMTLPEYAGLDINGLSWGGMLFGNLLPVTLGNIIGGVGFAALLWYCHKGGKEGT